MDKRSDLVVVVGAVTAPVAAFVAGFVIKVACPDCRVGTSDVAFFVLACAATVVLLHRR